VIGNVQMNLNATAIGPAASLLVISIGKCQNAQIKPKIRWDTTGLYFF